MDEIHEGDRWFGGREVRWKSGARLQRRWRCAPGILEGSAIDMRRWKGIQIPYAKATREHVIRASTAVHIHLLRLKNEDRR